MDQLRRALQRNKRKPSSTRPLPPEAVALVDLKGIPLDQMLRLAEAITAERPPVREVRLVEKVLPVA